VWQSPRSSPLDISLTDYSQEPSSARGLLKSSKMMNLSEENLQEFGMTAVNKVRDTSETSFQPLSETDGLSRLSVNL